MRPFKVTILIRNGEIRDKILKAERNKEDICTLCQFEKQPDMCQTIGCQER